MTYVGGEATLQRAIMRGIVARTSPTTPRVGEMEISGAPRGFEEVLEAAGSAAAAAGAKGPKQRGADEAVKGAGAVGRPPATESGAGGGAQSPQSRDRPGREPFPVELGAGGREGGVEGHDRREGRTISPPHDGRRLMRTVTTGGAIPF